MIEEIKNLCENFKNEIENSRSKKLNFEDINKVY